ncbi:hypothetical protein C9374_002710 [Naegleria lovaniensis]|uniref:Uncharacterized protein n=1 Tax=Naegleria lovaniensis TaxID=51637 RepID=A0AA88GU95_NAELO|nr:uncharacterized protein C9374_002710 [Naegleria lovaniensis]KAG2386264.1 hypothetical protein C9374_002710 [Naegleria lovaniensis]
MSKSAPQRNWLERKSNTAAPTSYASRVIRKIKGNGLIRDHQSNNASLMNTKPSSFRNRLLRVVSHLRPSSTYEHYSDPSSSDHHHHSMLLATLDSNPYNNNNTNNTTVEQQHPSSNGMDDNSSSLNFLHQHSSPLFHHLFSHDSSIVHSSNNTHHGASAILRDHQSMNDDHVFIHPIQSLSKLFQFIRNTYYVLEMVDEDDEMRSITPSSNLFHSKSQPLITNNEKEIPLKIIKKSPIGFEFDENDETHAPIMNEQEMKQLNNTEPPPFYSNIDKFLFRLFVSNDTKNNDNNNRNSNNKNNKNNNNNKNTNIHNNTIITTNYNKNTSMSENTMLHDPLSSSLSKLHIDESSFPSTLSTPHNSNHTLSPMNSIHNHSPTSNVIIFFIESIFSVIKSLSLITLVTVSYIHKRFDKYLKPIIVIEFSKLEKLLGKLIYNFKLYFRIGTNAKLTIARLLAKIRNNNPRNFYMILSIYLRMRNWMHIPKSFINQIFWTVTSIYFNILLFCIYLIEKIVSPRLLYLLTMTNDKLIEILDRVLSFVESYYHIVIENDRVGGVKRERHSSAAHSAYMNGTKKFQAVSPLQGTEN